jgi:hypothetical protein
MTLHSPAVPLNFQLWSTRVARDSRSGVFTTKEHTMKRFALMFAAIGVLAAGSAYAQMQIEPAVPRGLQDSNVQPARELPPAGAQVVDPAVPQLVMDRARGHSDADARRCLQFTSNVQIHRCAERYRSHARRASVTKTKAGKPAEAISPASRGKAADLGKPDMSKAANPAKPVDMTKAGPAAAPAPAAKSAAVEKPSTAPKAAAPEKPAEQTAQRPPKWTDNAKDTMKSRGAHLPD